MMYDEKGRAFEYIEVKNDGGRSRSRKRVKKLLFELGQGYEVKMGFWVLGSNLQGFVMGEREVFMKWLERMHRLLTEMGVRYMSVTEVGKRGRRIHSHMVVDRYIPWECVRAAWSTITGIKSPHVDVRLFDWGKAGNLCEYLSKYLTKGGGAVTMRGRNLQASKGLGKKSKDWYGEEELKKEKVKIYIRKYMKEKREGMEDTIPSEKKW